MLQVRLSCVVDGSSLSSLVQFLYLDDVPENEQLTPQLHQSAIACGLQRLVQLCEAHFAQQLELQLTSWTGMVRDMLTADDLNVCHHDLHRLVPVSHLCMRSFTWQCCC